MNGRIHHPLRVSIVYESMFRNTRRIAEAIGEGLSDAARGLDLDTSASGLGLAGVAR